MSAKKNERKKGGLFKNYSVKPFMSLIYSGSRIAIAHNSKFFVCFTSDCVNFIEYKTGEILHSISEKKKEDKINKKDRTILGIALSVDDRKIAISFDDGSVSIYSILSQKLLRKLQFAVPVVHMAFDNLSSAYLAFGFGTGEIKVYNVKTSVCTHTFRNKIQGRVGVLKFFPSFNITNKEEFVSKAIEEKEEKGEGEGEEKKELSENQKELCIFGSGLNGLTYFNLLTKKILRFDDHRGVILGIEFTNDGSKFVTTAVDKIFCVYDFRKKVLIKKITAFQDFVNLQIIPKDIMFRSTILEEKVDMSLYDNVSKDVILAGSRDGKIMAFDIDKGNVLIKNEDKNLKQAFQYSYLLKNEETKSLDIMFTTEDCNFVIYEVNKTISRKRQILGFHDEVLAIKSLAPESNEFVIATNNPSLIVFNKITKDSKFISGHSDVIMALDVSKNFKYLVSGSSDNTVRLWQLSRKANSEKKCIGIGDSHTGCINAVCFGKRTNSFFVSGSDDRTLKIYRLDELQESLKKNQSNSNTLPIPLDCQSVIAHSKEVNDVQVSPDESIIASCSSDRTVKLWGVENLDLQKTLNHPKPVWCIKFSPRERVIASGCSDKMIRIWSIVTGSCLKVLQGHTGSILQLSFVNFGFQLFSADSAGLSKLWVIKNNECINTFDKHEDRIWALETENNGKTIMTGGDDSKINIWTENTKLVSQENEELLKIQISKNQEFKNLLNNEQFEDALLLAISMDQPRNTYKIFQTIIKKNIPIEPIVSKLSFKEVTFLFQFCVDWNTNSRFCTVAHRVLSALFRVFDPNFVGWEYSKSLESLISYSNKHLKRIHKLLESSYVLDFTAAQMNIINSGQMEIEPIEEVENEEEKQKEISNVENRKRIQLLDPELEISDYFMVNSEENINKSIQERKDKKNKKKRKRQQQIEEKEEGVEPKKRKI